jgi:hypothetical protein
MFASSIESADTIRQPRSAFLLIDSADRAQQSGLFTENVFIPEDEAPLNDFTIFKRQPFLSGYFTRLSVTEVRLDYATPNVNERNNNIDVVIANGPNAGQYTVTLTENYYTPLELAAALEDELNLIAVGETWTVVYNEDTYNFIVDNTSGNDWEFLPYPYTTLAQTRKGLYYMINWGAGLGPGTADDLITMASLPFPPLRYTDYIDVCSRQLTQYQKVKDNSTRENQTPAVLCRLYLANYTAEGVGKDPLYVSYWPGLSPTVVHRLFNVPKYSAWSPGQFIDQIDIQLRDDVGNLLYIPSELRTSLNFQLTCHASES